MPMRKLIAILSVISALGFAAALAATNDTSNSNPSDQGQSASDMSGTAGENTSAGNPSASNPSDTTSQEKSSDQSSTTSSTSKKSDKWSKAKKCTDENGVTYYKGKTGFQACVDKMRKHEQMGGTSP